MKTLTMSDVGLALTKTFEGLRLQAYQDPGGIWTIGYGHTGRRVTEGLRISAAEAEALLRQDLESAIAAVNRFVTVDLEQHQFDALVDFCFNVGCRHFERSSLLAFVNEAKPVEAAGEFAKWVMIQGQTAPGLVRRRAAEAALFRGSSSAVSCPS